MLKKEVTGSSEPPGGAVPTHFIWTVEPHQPLPHLERLPVCSTLQGSHQGWRHQRQAKHLLLFLAPLQQKDKAPCPGKAHTCPAEPRRTTALLVSHSDQTPIAGKVKLRFQQLIFCTKWELRGWPGARRSQGPFSEDMDLSVHNEPPAPPPCTDMLCRVMSTSRACMAWEWRTHESQAAYGRCSPSNAHWSSTSFSGHTIERGKEKGREEMRRKAQKLFTH